MRKNEGLILKVGPKKMENHHNLVLIFLKVTLIVESNFILKKPPKIVIFKKCCRGLKKSEPDLDTKKSPRASKNYLILKKSPRY